jgi:hypothetical protein
VFDRIIAHGYVHPQSFVPAIAKVEINVHSLRHE